MRAIGIVSCLILVACSQREVGSAAESKELVPAEWTVAEDTSATGDVTTASLQLPAAKAIPGLLDSEDPQLVLQCIDGRVEAFIEVDSAATSDSASRLAPVRIQLDSAPACE